MIWRTGLYSVERLVQRLSRRQLGLYCEHADDYRYRPCATAAVVDIAAGDGRRISNDGAGRAEHLEMPVGTLTLTVLTANITNLWQHRFRRRRMSLSCGATCVDNWSMNGTTTKI